MSIGKAPTVTTESGSLAKWGSWLAALVGLWVVASPFVLDGTAASGTAMWSNVVAGAVVLILGAFSAYTIRTAAETEINTLGESSGWLAALFGAWILVSPFVVGGTIAGGWMLRSNVVAGALAVVFAGYTGYFLTAGE